MSKSAPAQTRDQRQEDELQALRAIYAEDWHDVPPKKTAWGTAAEEGWWEVRVKGEDERVQVGIKGRMTKMYPNQPPLLQLNEPHSLSPAHVQALHALLVSEAKRRVGQEMIYDLVETAREYLGTHHLPLPRPGEVQPTLMEQRLQREEAQRAAEAAQSLVEAEERRRAERDEAAELSARIQQDGEKKAERAERAEKEEEGRRRMESLRTLRDGELDSRLLSLESAVRVEGYEGRWADWILFGGKRERLWTTYLAEPISGAAAAVTTSPNLSTGTGTAPGTMVTPTLNAGMGVDGFVKTSLPLVEVQVIDFSKPFYSEPMGKKKVEALAHEITRLQEVRSPHVRRIYAVKRTLSPKGWERIMVVVEKCGGGPLRDWLPPTGYGEERAREYLAQVFRGLGEVCRVGATQRQLDPDSVVLCPPAPPLPLAGGEPLVKLCSTSYARKIDDLHRSNPFLGPSGDPVPESWLAPDELDAPYSYTPKRDVYHAGLLFLQLLLGPGVLHRYPGLRILLQQEDRLSTSTTELLGSLLAQNPKKRPSAEEALNRLLEDQKRLRISGLPSPSVSGSGTHSRGLALRSPLEVTGTSPLKDWYFSPAPLASHQSRYRQDFEEVEFLGKGGFGEVVKARNKLDGKFYAIKKIKLRPQDNEKKVLREVQTLSKVNHQFIVRYQHCWLEDATPPSMSSPHHDQETPNAKPSDGSDQTEDIFAVNFDDFSTGSARFDNSRSASFPRIRFANDEDSDEEESSEEEDTEAESSSGETADPSQPAKSMFQTPAVPVPGRPSTTTGTHTTMEEGAVQKILYISMEFVEKQSLREAITTGLSNEEAWRLLGQILQALAYMASLGIVHRDLKPSNILLDSLGNVKIADFGLSTTEITAEHHHHHHHLPAAHSAEGNEERTSNIGTSLYIAPEVAMTRSYNEKADMYSLGIIFFEMCFCFSTAMERVHILTALRRATIDFPPAWPVGLVNQREIVNYLLQHDPTKRPSATTLLTSPLLPSPERQQEYYDSAIRELTSTRSAQYPNLLKALFRPRRDQPWTYDRTDDYLYDNLHLSSRSSAIIASYEIWESVVVSRLAQLFERHGAVETQLPLLLPETSLLEPFPDLHPVRLLDNGGKIVQLPYNGLLGMARTAARRGVERNKRYLVGRKYREHRAGGQPETAGQLCFDIISPLKSHAADAELLEVADQVFGELSGGKASNSDWEIHVNHESLLGILLGAVPERQRQQVLRIFQSGQVDAGRGPFSGISGLGKPLLDDLEAFLVPDEIESYRRRLEAAFPAQKRKLGVAIEELNSIVALARLLGVYRRIVLRPTLAKHAEYFRSAFFFEAVSVRRGKARDTIAYGGRYDSLLLHFQEPGLQGRQVFGAGVSLDIDMLVRMLQRSASAAAEKLMKKENEEERSFGFWMPARCDVYVASVAQVDLPARLSIMGELWRGGVRADLQYDDDRAVELVAEECAEQNILFLLLPRANRQMIKVRSILRRTEEEVPLGSMVAYLRQAIADQRRIDASYASVEPALTSSGAAVPGMGDKAELDIRLILPPEPQSAKGTKGRPVRKHRHGTKAVYYDKAEDFAASTQSRLPIYGVDLPLGMLSELTRDAAWVDSDDAWRAVLAKEALGTGDKKYADQVREAVREGAKRDGWCWLFGVREGRGFLLQLSTK